MRKRIDRYVSVAFLVRLLGCLLLIAVLYTTFDVLKRLEDLREEGLRESLSLLAAYYGRVVPVFLMDLVPGLVLVSAGMTLVRMSKSRELLALKAAGTSMHRVAAPIFFWTLLISVAAFAVREFIVPDMVRGRQVVGRMLDGKTERSVFVTDPGTGRMLYIGEYDVAAGRMKNVAVFEFHPGGTLSRTVRADSAEWKPGGGLLLRNVWQREFSSDATPNPDEPPVLTELELDVALTPLDLVEAAREDASGAGAAQGLGQLRESMRTHHGVPSVRVAFHSRLAGFFTPIILLLAGVPLLIGTERSVNSRMFGVIVCILLATGLYVLTFIFTSMGSTGTLDPLVAGWMPTIMAGAGGLWLFQSMLT